jgi:hypothetical protein
VRTLLGRVQWDVCIGGWGQGWARSIDGGEGCGMCGTQGRGARTGAGGTASASGAGQIDKAGLQGRRGGREEGDFRAQQQEAVRVEVSSNCQEQLVLQGQQLTLVVVHRWMYTCYY